MIALIPAKGTSERLPEKNTRLINGKSLVKITAETALASNCFEKIIVTSESHGLLLSLPAVGKVHEKGIWRHYRDPKLSGPKVTTHTVCRDVLQHQKILPKSFCLLIPTVPLRTAADIRKAYRQFKDNCLMSLSPAEILPQHLVRIKNGYVQSSPRIDDKRQDFKYYHHDGYLIMCDTKKFFEATDFYDMVVTPWFTPKERNLDINTMDDLWLARMKMENQSSLRQGVQQMIDDMKCKEHSWEKDCNRCIDRKRLKNMMEGK